MSYKRHRFAAGFTLIEIVTVVVVMAILAILALPDLNAQSDLSASAAARVVVSDLLYAQSQAISNQAFEYVPMSVATSVGGWGSYSLCNTTTFSTPITNPVTLQPYRQKFGSGGTGPLSACALYSVTLDSPANTVLVFNELGQPFAMPATGSPVALVNTGLVVLQCGTDTVTISIEPSTGNISVSP